MPHPVLLHLLFATAIIVGPLLIWLPKLRGCNEFCEKLSQESSSKRISVKRAAATRNFEEAA